MNKLPQFRKGVTMNREILFRGKRLDNRGWVYGSYNRIVGTTEMMVKFDVSDKREHEFKMVELNIHLITQNYLPDTQGWDYNGCFRHHKVAPESVGQFTGLTDKNGVKIFEGDVLLYKWIYENYRHEKKKCEKYVIVSFGWMWNDNDGRHEQNYLGWSAGENEPLDSDHDYEVIGNIHDNPELIK